MPQGGTCNEQRPSFPYTHPLLTSHFIVFPLLSLPLLIRALLVFCRSPPYLPILFHSCLLWKLMQHPLLHTNTHMHANAHCTQLESTHTHVRKLTVLCDTSGGPMFTSFSLYCGIAWHQARYLISWKQTIRLLKKLDNFSWENVYVLCLHVILSIFTIPSWLFDLK